MTKKQLIKIALPILIIALAVGSFSFLKSSKTERKKPKAEEKVWQVEMQTITLEHAAAELTLFATVESSALHTASAPAAGIIERTFVKAGNHVQQGDVLIKLEQQDFINRTHQAKADVLDIQAQLNQLKLKQDTNIKALQIEQDLLALSQSEMDRVKRLKQKGLGSDSVLTNAKSALAKQQLSTLNKSTEVAQYPSKKQQLQAKLMRLNASLNQANLALSRSTISANFNGIIASVNVSNGDRVKTAEALLSLYPTQQLEAKTRVPTRYQYDIQKMLLSDKKVTASAQIADNDITLQLERIAGQARANGIEVYFKITQGQQWLKVGNFLKLHIKLQKQKDVIKLPLQALYGTARIYRVEENRLQGIDVETIGYSLSKNNQQQVLIRHPTLSNGDKILITHLPNAITGLKVTTGE